MHAVHVVIVLHNIATDTLVHNYCIQFVNAVLFFEYNHCTIVYPSCHIEMLGLLKIEVLPTAGDMA